MIPVGAAWSVLRRFWPAIPIIGLAIALWITRGTLERRTEKLANVVAEFSLFRKAVEIKAAEALAAQMAVNKAKEAQYVTAAIESQSDYNDLRARYAEQLRRNQANRSASRGTSVTAEIVDTGVSENPAAMPELVLSADDAMKLPALQAYAQSCFTWAQKLAATNGP